MKGVALIIIALLAVSTAFAIDAELRNPLVLCDSSGNIFANYLHSGGIIQTSEIDAKALFTGTNATSDVEGYWEMNGQNVSYITESSTTKSSKVFFYSTNMPFTKTGDYVLNLRFFSSNNDYSETDVTAKFSCPGIDCSGNTDCKLDEICSDEGKCTALKCKYGEFVDLNRCSPICNDRNSCTEDVYSNGHCIYKQTGDCCITNADCNDGMACTTERCSENKCVASLVKCEAATDRCVTSSCIEPRGCVYESDAECLGVESNKREYFITIGTPTVQKKSFFTSIGEWIDNFFRNLF